MLRPSNYTGALIHELMHAFQNAFPGSGWGEYDWWGEATVNWAIHYVESVDPSPDTNFEHLSASEFLNSPALALEDTAGYREYGAYLFPFFLQVTTGKVDFVRASYERAGTMLDSLKNINGLIPGGFHDQWPAFTPRNLNTPPVDDYIKADGMPYKARLRDEFSVALGGARSNKYPLEGNVGHLASHAYRFTFSDATVRSVMFQNPFAEEGTWPTAAVRALVKVGGQWKEEDWTALKTRALCRDLVAERVEELYVVISNSEFDDRSHKLAPAKSPRLEVSNVACHGWEGVVRYHDWNRDEIDTGVYLSEGTTDYETPVKLTRTEAPLGLYPGALHFSPAPDTVVKVRNFGWALDGHEPPRTCAFDDRTTVPISVERSSLVIYGDSGAYDAGGDMPITTMTQTDSCGAPFSFELNRTWWKNENTAASQAYVSADGTHIAGRYDKVKRADEPNAEIYYTWELTALPPE